VGQRSEGTARSRSDQLDRDCEEILLVSAEMGALMMDALAWLQRESRVRWKVVGPSGKRVLAYSTLDRSYGHATLLEAILAAKREAGGK
jgi:hypothetical protein